VVVTPIPLSPLSRRMIEDSGPISDMLQSSSEARCCLNDFCRPRIQCLLDGNFSSLLDYRTLLRTLSVVATLKVSSSILLTGVPSLRRNQLGPVLIHLSEGFCMPS
jgi:hypothetical protein